MRLILFIFRASVLEQNDIFNFINLLKIDSLIDLKIDCLIKLKTDGLSR